MSVLQFIRGRKRCERIERRLGFDFQPVTEPHTSNAQTHLVNRSRGQCPWACRVVMDVDTTVFSATKSPTGRHVGAGTRSWDLGWRPIEHGRVLRSSLEVTSQGRK